MNDTPNYSAPPFTYYDPLQPIYPIASGQQSDHAAVNNGEMWLDVVYDRWYLPLVSNSFASSDRPSPENVWNNFWIGENDDPSPLKIQLWDNVDSNVGNKYIEFFHQGYLDKAHYYEYEWEMNEPWYLSQYTINGYYFNVNGAGGSTDDRLMTPGTYRMTALVTIDGNMRIVQNGDVWLDRIA